VDCLISAEGVEMEFRDTIARIGRQFRERRLDELIRRAREGELGDEERNEMRRLIDKTRDSD
jgi:DNA primase